MIVECIETRRNKLPSWHNKYTPKEGVGFEFGGLTKGKKYLVCAIDMFPDGASYLIQDVEEPRFPYTAPWQMFSVIDSIAPARWFSGERKSAVGVIPTIGYKEWVQDYDHVEGVIEGEPGPLDLFEERAREIRNQVNDRILLQQSDEATQVEVTADELQIMVNTLSFVAWGGEIPDLKTKTEFSAEEIGKLSNKIRAKLKELNDQ